MKGVIAAERMTGDGERAQQALIPRLLYQFLCQSVPLGMIMHAGRVAGFDQLAAQVIHAGREDVHEATQQDHTSLAMLRQWEVDPRGAACQQSHRRSERRPAATEGL